MNSDGLERSPFRGAEVFCSGVKIEDRIANEARAYLARKGELGLAEMLGL